MALNYIWLAFFLIGYTVAIITSFITGKTEVFTTMLNGIFDSAKTGFDISLGLAGIMTLWLGVMKVGERAGVIQVFARAVAPFFRALFRGVPDGHPAFGSMTMNFSANMLGLDNAATPLGLKAMEDLQSLNPQKDTASNAQIMFLVLNTAGITLIPTSVIAMRQTIAMEQHIQNFNAADIFLPTLIATFIAFIAGMVVVSIFQRINLLRLPILLFVFGFATLIALLYIFLHRLPPEQMNAVIGAIGSVFILSIIVLFLIAGFIKKQNVYEHFIEGAKEGFQVVVRIVPYLVAMLVAISVFRNSGCMTFLQQGIVSVVGFFGLPTDFAPDVPIALMKPLSGSGARGLMVDVMKTSGVNSFQGKLAAVIQGTTETTFYVVSVYFGTVQITKTRYALAAGLIADAIGLIAAIIIGYAFFK